MIGIATYPETWESTDITKLKTHAIDPETMAPFCNRKMKAMTYNLDSPTSSNIDCKQCKKRARVTNERNK